MRKTSGSPEMSFAVRGKRQKRFIRNIFNERLSREFCVLDFLLFHAACSIGTYVVGSGEEKKNSRFSVKNTNAATKRRYHSER